MNIISEPATKISEPARGRSRPRRKKLYHLGTTSPSQLAPARSGSLGTNRALRQHQNTWPLKRRSHSLGSSVSRITYPERKSWSQDKGVLCGKGSFTVQYADGDKASASISRAFEPHASTFDFSSNSPMIASTSVSPVRYHSTGRVRGVHADGSRLHQLPPPFKAFEPSDTSRQRRPPTPLDSKEKQNPPTSSLEAERNQIPRPRRPPPMRPITTPTTDRRIDVRDYGGSDVTDVEETGSNTRESKCRDPMKQQMPSEKQAIESSRRALSAAEQMSVSLRKDLYQAEDLFWHSKSQVADKGLGDSPLREMYNTASKLLKQWWEAVQFAEEVLAQIKDDIKDQIQDSYSLGREVDKTRIVLKSVRKRKQACTFKLQSFLKQSTPFTQDPYKTSELYYLLDDNPDITFASALFETPLREISNTNEPEWSLEGNSIANGQPTFTCSPIALRSPLPRNIHTRSRSRPQRKSENFQEIIFDAKQRLNNFKNLLRKDPGETSRSIRLASGNLRQQLFQAEDLFNKKKAQIEGHWPWLISSERVKGSFISTYPTNYPCRRGLPWTELTVADYNKLLSTVRCILEQWNRSTAISVGRLAELNSLLQKQVMDVLELGQSLEIMDIEISEIKRKCAVIEESYYNAVHCSCHSKNVADRQRQYNSDLAVVQSQKDSFDFFALQFI